MLEVDFSSFPELRTKRMLLRRITKRDAPEILSLRSSEVVMKYIDREKTRDIADAEVYLDKINLAIDNNDAVQWGMALLEKPGQIIGSIGYWRMKKEHYRAEVGYMLHPDFWRKGIMKEVLETVLHYGFTQMKLHSIEANINPANDASAKLLESVGFVQEAYFREDYYFNGAFHDTIIYSLLEKNLVTTK